MAGLTETGFQRRTYDEIVAYKILKAQELFGANINTDENTPLGKFIRINAYDEALLSEDMETIYYSIFPNSASGVSLDRLCTFIGITRNPATASRYSIRVSGTIGETIPMGFLFGTESGIKFYTINSATFGDDGSGGGAAIVTVDCTELGEIGNVSTQDITQIINPSVYVSGITNVSLVSYGDDIESDYALRKRFEIARDGMGSSNAPSLISSILRVPTVTAVGIVENTSDTTDVSGRPAHSFECYVEGGTLYQQEIAERIFEKKPIGIMTHGTITQTITDSAGTTHTIKFSRPTTVNVYIIMTIKIDSSFDNTSGQLEIKEKVANKISSLGIGNSLYLSTLYGEIHSVTGVKEIQTLEAKTSAAEEYSSNNIIVQSYEKCVCIPANVNIVID